MRKPILAANWKMNKDVDESVAFTDELNSKLAGKGEGIDIVICPAFTSLKLVSNSVECNVQVGAQNMFWEEKGAFTGEISPQMLKSSGCTYVIIGHSERRQYFSETNETVNKKILAALKHNLIPILCVGETLEERDTGTTNDKVLSQIEEALCGVNNDIIKTVHIAYEPIWAIGTGRSATPSQANDVHKVIRWKVGEMFNNEVAASLRILYGGSVKPENVNSLFKEPDIDGALVGGASLSVKSFMELVDGLLRN